MTALWIPPRPAVLRGLTIEQAKAELRLAHKRRRPRCYAEAVAQAWEDWRRYEQLNRDYLPDDPVYSVANNKTPAATDDLVTFLAVASRSYRVLEIIIGSEGTTSTACRAVWQTTTGGTTITGRVPEKFNANSPASMFSATTCAIGWATHPTVTGNPKMTWSWNSLGGFIDWKAAPGEEIYHTNEQASLKNQAGTAALGYTAVIEEL
jgi:hypothetical protein